MRPGDRAWIDRHAQKCVHLRRVEGPLLLTTSIPIDRSLMLVFRATTLARRVLSVWSPRRLV